MQPEFVEDVPDVVLHRVLRDEEQRSDLAAGVALGYQLEDLDLAPRERRLAGGQQLFVTEQLVSDIEQLAGHRRRQCGAAGFNGVDRRNQLGERCVLGHVPAGTGFDTDQQVFLRLACREQQDLRAR